MNHRILLAVFIALPLFGAHHLNSVNTFLHRYHSGSYELMIRRMAHGPHLIGAKA